MIRSLTAGVLVMGMLISGAAFAQGLRGGGPGRAGGTGRGVVGLPLASLNLTQAQQDAIADIRERGRVQLREVEERMQSEILSVLTPAQQEQVKTGQAEREQRRKELEARRFQRQ